MLRKILSTTALVAVVSTGAAFAQSASTADPMIQPEASPQMEGGQMDSGAKPVFPGLQAEDESASGFYSATDKQVLASALLGWPVYGENDGMQEREKVGDINDIVLNADGSVDAAVIGVGGFLGIGEKKVAVSFDRLSWQQGENGEWLSIDATRAQLEAAPEFQPGDEAMMGAGTAETMAGEAEELAGTAGNALDRAGDAAGQAMDDVAESVGNAGDAMRDEPGMMTSSDNPMMEGMSEVDMTSISYDDLQGAPVLSADGDSVGEISDVLAYGARNEDVFIVDVGGFLGIGEKPVAISAETATIMSDGDSYLVKTKFDRETLENQPEYTEQGLLDNPDAVLLY